MNSTFHVSNFSKQTNIFFSHSFVQFFAKKIIVANVHENVRPFSSIIYILIHKYHLSMNTWQNIHPHHQIFYPICQIILSKYYVDVNKIFQKRFTHVHLLMFTYSLFTLTSSRAHKITSLVYLWSMCGLLIIVINNISSIIILIVIAS